MGKKVNPIGLRTGVIKSWRSKWYEKKEYSKNLEQDIGIREGISKKWRPAGIADVEIERSATAIKIIIKTARPGVLIGRGGKGIDNIKEYVVKTFFKNNKKVNVKIEVQEIKNFEESAQVIAQNIAEQLEKRMPFRRVMKSMIEQITKNRQIQGVKIELSGRLGGAEMSRREWASKGNLPLHTLRIDIDFARATAYTTYGTLGIKVWINKGEIFEKK